MASADTVKQAPAKPMPACAPDSIPAKNQIRMAPGGEGQCRQYSGHFPRTCAAPRRRLFLARAAFVCSDQLVLHFLQRGQLPVLGGELVGLVFEAQVPLRDRLAHRLVLRAQVLDVLPGALPFLHESARHPLLVASQHLADRLVIDPVGIAMGDLDQAFFGLG